MRYCRVASLVVATLVISPVTAMFAQGGGGTEGASSYGFNGGSASGNAMQSQQTQSTSQTPIQDSGVTTGTYLFLKGDKPGTAANGKPIGSPGSGLGSPEEPYDARRAR